MPKESTWYEDKIRQGRLSEREERTLRKLWRLPEDYEICIRTSGGGYRTDFSYKSKKTGNELGYRSPLGLYYYTPYFKFGRVGRTSTMSGCFDSQGYKLCLCTEDLIVLNDAVRDVLLKGPENITKEVRELIGRLRERCPTEMVQVKHGLEDYEDFRKFFIEGPPVPREEVENFEHRKKFEPDLTLEEWLKRGCE